MIKPDHRNKFLSILTICVSVVWIVAVGLDYFNKHPSYAMSFQFFKYYGLYSFVLILMAFVVFHYKYNLLTKLKIPVNGLTLAVLSFIFTFALIFSHKNYAYSPTGFGQIMTFCGRAWVVILMIFVLLMIMQSVGFSFYRRVLKSHISPNYLLDIAIGIIFFVFSLFILGLFGFINPNSVIALLFVFSLINLFYLVNRIKHFFIKKIDVSKFNTLGILSFLFIMFFILLNFLSSQGPFPSGFDSRNFYINISKLIADNNGLVEGFQPYNWSLFMGIGFVLFEKVELALGLSFVSIVLVLLATYQFAIRKLKLGKNMVLFVLALFIVTPAVTNQMYIELKVDFGMLFYQILILHYTIELLGKLRNTDFNRELKSGLKPLIPLVLLVGILTSFALGIKMINMFLVFSILALIWWDEKNKFGTIGVLCFTLLLFLIAGIDEISGLDKYHLGEHYIKILFFIVALSAFAYSLYKYRIRSLARLVISVVFLFSSGLLILPWMAKNYSESKSFNPRTLLMGKDPGPNTSVDKFVKEYEKSKNK